MSGGIYGGVFTVTEAASLGAVTTFLLAVMRARVTMAGFLAARREAAANTAMIYISIIGASIMTCFVGLTRVSNVLAAVLVSLDIPPLMVSALLLVLFPSISLYLVGVF